MAFGLKIFRPEPQAMTSQTGGLALAWPAALGLAWLMASGPSQHITIRNAHRFRTSDDNIVLGAGTIYYSTGWHKVGRASVCTGQEFTTNLNKTAVRRLVGIRAHQQSHTISKVP